MNVAVCALNVFFAIFNLIGNGYHLNHDGSGAAWLRIAAVAGNAALATAFGLRAITHRSSE